MERARWSPTVVPLLGRHFAPIGILARLGVGEKSAGEGCCGESGWDGETPGKSEEKFGEKTKLGVVGARASWGAACCAPT